MSAEVDAAIVSAGAGAVGFVAGFLVSRFTMSKADRKGFEQQNYVNAREHRKTMEERSQDFQGALRSYIAKDDGFTLDDFSSISRSGDLYFGELKAIADAILSDKVDAKSRDKTFTPAIVEALQKSIPAYYDALRNIASKVGAPYTGELRRENYESMYEVAERYGTYRPIRS